MNWVISTLLMFFSSVILYLFVRKAKEQKIPSAITLFAMFFTPFVVFLIMALNQKISFEVKTWELILLAVQGIVFAYLGNTFSLKGIEYAPNPGYSLIISKSYVVFTAIASIFLFQSTLSLSSVIAIVLIIIFSAFIAIDKNKKGVNYRPRWLPFTLGAFLGWGLLALTTKYLLVVGMPILIRLVYSLGIMDVMIVGEVFFTKTKLTLTKNQVFTLLMVGVFCTSFNYFTQVAFNLAPNIGYVNAANAASISLLTLMSAWIFKDELNKQKVTGIIGVTIGLFILFL